MKAHGYCRLEASGRVLLVDVEAPWNAESALAYKRYMTNAMKEMGQDQPEETARDWLATQGYLSDID